MDIDASPMAERIEGRLDRLGLEAAEAARFIRAESAKWAPILQASGIRAG